MSSSNFSSSNSGSSSNSDSGAVQVDDFLFSDEEFSYSDDDGYQNHNNSPVSEDSLDGMWKEYDLHQHQMKVEQEVVTTQTAENSEDLNVDDNVDQNFITKEKSGDGIKRANAAGKKLEKIFTDMSIETHDIDKEQTNEEEHISTKNDEFNVKRKRSSDSQTIQDLKNEIFLLKKKFKQVEGEKLDIFGDDELPKPHTFTIKLPEGLIIRRKFVRRRGGDDKNFREKVSISTADSDYLNKNQAQITENFLDKYANSELHVFEGKYDNILLLNIPFNFDNFEKFMSEYNKDFWKHGTRLTGTSPTSTPRYETSSDFYLNSLKSIDEIKDLVQNVFNVYNRTVVKVQMKFSVV
jgi:hypothetical protein